MMITLELDGMRYDPYTVFIAPYSLSWENPLKFTSLQNINSWICAVQLPAASSHTDECDIIYLCK